MSKTLRAPTAHAALALTLALIAGGAHAQVAGTYAGTTSDGLSIEITLVNSETDGLVFTGSSTQWNETCKTGDVKFAWWGIGAYLPVSAKKLSSEYKGQSLYQTLTMKFDVSGTTVTGTVKAGEATYVDVNSSIKQTEPCNSGLVTYTATLQSPLMAARHHGLPAGSVQAFTR